MDSPSEMDKQEMSQGEAAPGNPSIVKKRRDSFSLLRKVFSADDVSKFASVSTSENHTLPNASEENDIPVVEFPSDEENVTTKPHRSYAIVTPPKSYEEGNKKVREEAQKKRNEKQSLRNTASSETDTGSLRVHDEHEHKPLTMAHIREIRNKAQEDPKNKKNKKEKKEKKGERKRKHEPVKEEHLRELKQILLKELPSSTVLKDLEDRRSRGEDYLVKVVNPLYKATVETKNPIFKEGHISKDHIVEVKNPVYGAQIGLQRHSLNPEFLDHESPKLRSKSEMPSIRSRSKSPTSAKPQHNRSLSTGETITGNSWEAHPPDSEIHFIDDYDGHSASENRQSPVAFLSSPRPEHGSSDSSPLPSPSETPTIESPSTQAKVENMKIFLTDYYWGLFNYLNERKQRRKHLEDHWKETGRSRMIALAEYYKSESEQLRKRRTRMKVLEFVQLATIGKGGFANVFLVRHKTGAIFALKRMNKIKMKQKNQLTRIMTEKEILAATHSSPWLVHLHSSFQDADHFYLVMEYVPGGDLATLLSHVGPLPQHDAKFYIVEMILAVAALHKMGYIHRDLKPSNFLIDKQGHIKLADFGLSKKGMKELYRDTLKIQDQLRVSEMTRKDSIRDFTKNSQVYLANRKRQQPSIVGSCEYMAWEIVMGQEYDYEVDWWSMGSILFELIIGVPPFFADTPMEVFENVLEYKRVLIEWRSSLAEQQNTSLSPMCWDLLEKLLCEPSNRLQRSEDVLAHPFFSNIDLSAIRAQKPPFVPQLADDTDFSYFDTEDIVEDVDDPNKLLHSASDMFKAASSDTELLDFTFKLPSKMDKL